MILMCIDGGLICGPVLLWIGGTIVAAFGGSRFFKWCSNKCKCECHTKTHGKILPQFNKPAITKLNPVDKNK